MKKVNKIIILFLFSIISFSCFQQNKKENIISGNLSNLPNGTMYLSQEQFFNKIDSVKTVNGKFEFKYINNKNDEPKYLVLNHIDENGVFRFIGFKTNGKFKNSNYESSSFLSDTLVKINGSLIDKTPIGYDPTNMSKMMTVSNEIKTGYQTRAMFNTDGDLFYNLNKNTFEKVLAKIKEYPNSFHLLFQIDKNRNSFLPNQINDFLKNFKGEITNSETFKRLNEYNTKRINKNKLVLPKLTDNNGNKREVLDAKFKKHLVVFWASWCGPCREEIPSLKKMYSKYKGEIEFVSISTDSNNLLWQKALKKEAMPWNQFVVNEKSKEYEPIEIFFQLSTSIPYTVLIDNNMKVIKSQVGLMNEIEMEKFIKNN